MRLQSFLSKAGIASRRHAADLIKKGCAKVNCNIIYEKGFNIDPEIDRVFINGKEVFLRDSYFYIIFNKPKNVISTSSDTHKRSTPLDFIPKKFGRLFIVGRLDKDTTGLLFLTNNGEVANRIIHPRFEIPKRYEITLNKEISLDQKLKLEKGIMLEGKITLPVKIEILNCDSSGSKLLLEMREGRKHQIKNMFKALGLTVKSLKRISIGPIKLGGLKEGKFRELTKEEIVELNRYLKLIK